ncbi:MAG: DUF4037 domain-containing protein, partial [Oscillospiraceae bacterium]|nr:DUF4037 domain-containing protein [Oscillospiraceae bacterium]
MKGLELSRLYYEQVGLPMLKRGFPAVLDRLAAGLVGEGSECFGYDDEISRDHDYGPSFCLWLTEADYETVGPTLARAYAALPGDFLGVPRRREEPYGTGRVGVLSTDAFYRRFLGLACPPETAREWLFMNENALAAATNGAVFSDPLGEFSGIRRAILGYYPEDVRRKKIAARAVTMAQAGQYNYARCMRRGESGAASLALGEFVRAAVSMIYLLNRRYAPYYKWVFRVMEDLPSLVFLRDKLTRLTELPGQADCWPTEDPMRYASRLNLR